MTPHRFLNRFAPHLLLLLLLAAGAARLYQLDAPGLVLEREYRSSLLARHYFFEHSEEIAAWRKEVAQVAAARETILEPPLAIYLVGWIYLVVGEEQLWIPRIMMSIFWLIGGIFLYLLAKRLTSPGTAVLATAYYLFVPLGYLISRSFQPDALMMMFYLMSLYGIVRYFDQPTRWGLIAVALISGISIVYRPLVFFTTLGAFATLSLNRYGFKQFWRQKDVWLYFGLTLLPSLAYYGYGIFVADFLRWKVTTSFLPHLFFTWQYWAGWLLVASNAVTMMALIGAFWGILILPIRTRFFLIGLSISYILFCFVFNYHVHFANYYHLQLIPIVAISLAQLIFFLTEQVQKQLTDTWTIWIPFVIACTLTMFSFSYSIYEQLGSQFVESQETADAIGALVNHNTNVVYVATYYGEPLQYMAEIAGIYWPRSNTASLYRQPGTQALSVNERLRALPFTPDYFVITYLGEYERHHQDLQEYLTDNCQLTAESQQYLIYGHCQS